MRMDGASRVVQFASYNFDASITEMLTTLVVGGCVCVVAEAARLDPVAFTAAVAGMRGNFALLTASFISALPDDGLRGLRTLVQGGEALPAAVLARWADRVTLMNAYGQVEASVVSTCTAAIPRQGSDGRSIGTAVAGRCWVVDPEDANKMVHPGGIGELLVEGPHVGRGYLDEPEKTAAVFIRRPVWHTRMFPAEADPRALRFYRTGDLVVQEADGTFTFAGRKDEQVKVNGQRIEVGEIEHQFKLAMDPPRDVVVELVKRKTNSGTRGTLVAFVALGQDASGDEAVDRQLLEKEMAVTEAKVRAVLPKFMIPATYLAVEQIPISLNGKVDRKSLRALGEARLSQKKHSALKTTPESKGFTQAEEQIRQIWSRVLNVPTENIERTSIFQSLGGDSISAMQVVSQAAAQGMRITMQRILQQKTIEAIAAGLTVAPPSKTTGPVTFDEEEDTEAPFSLSPIQRLFFNLKPEGDNRDNISFLLRLNQKISHVSLDEALEAVVLRNSMLRARFFELKRGKWFQYISEDTVESYSVSSHTIEDTSSDVMRIVGNSQRSLDIKFGPLLHADLINVPRGQGQLLFICAHHLVTDFVSFRAVMQQLEEHLQTGTISAPKGFSFQRWCKEQESYIRRLPPQELSFGLPYSDPSFWGMQDLPNVYGDADTEAVVLDKELSSAILGAASNGPLEVEAVDVLLSAAMLAFHNVFPERPVPAFFVEGHGREPWDDTIDLSSTVGWFTTILPMVLSQNGCTNTMDALREVKSLRAKFPDKGLAHFASKYYQRKKTTSTTTESPMEVTFNYAGMYQQLERPGSLFSEIPERTLMNLDGFGEALPRFGLVEILGNVDRGHVKLSFTFNRRMRHLDRVRLWMQECRQVLAAMASQLRHAAPWFPLLRVSAAETARLSDVVLPGIGVSVGDVEDVYPCSPMQNGMLLSRAGQRGSYVSELFMEVQQREGSIDLARLELAWQALVDRHAALRTVFVESVRADGSFDQVVLRSSRAAVTRVHGSLEGRLHSAPWAPNQPEHRLFVQLKSPGCALLRLDISHVLIDGSSTPTLMQDLQSAYESLDVFKSGPPPLYSSYIKHVSTLSHEEAVNYWKQHLSGTSPCHLSQWSDAPEGSLEFTSVPRIDSAKTTAFCREIGITVSDLLKAVWALVLRRYTGSESPVFGYLSSGRDEEYGQSLGVFTNIQPCVARLSSTSTVLHVLKMIQDDSIDQIAHRECPLADVIHSTEVTDAAREGLFNTAMSLQRTSSTPEDRQIVIRMAREMDPTEYAVTFLGYVTDTGLDLVIEYLTSKVSTFQAENIAATVAKVVQSIVEKPRSTIQDIDVVSERDKGTLRQWNARLRDSAPVENCIHHLIESIARADPDHVAVDAWDAKLTYGELDRLSSRLAAHLYFLGVRPEVIVPVCMEKSAWTIVAMLSVLKAGGAFVPFDPEAPLDRLLQLLDDTSACFVIASPKTASRLQEHIQQIVVSRTFIARLPERQIPQEISPENLAYILFTSGSTGTPKGIMMQHSQFLASSTRYSPLLHLNASSRVLQFSAYTFDASIFEIWSTLTSGGCVCQISDEQRMNDVAGAINALGANAMFMTPTMLGLMSPHDVPRIATIITGGEVIPQDVFRTWAPAARLVEAYGPTETAVYATFQADVQPDSDRLSIGHSFCCVPWVVDPATEALLPVGAAGELWLAGPSVARGYLNNEAQTARAFVARPDWLDAGRVRRFYRTGDLVRFKQDGSLQFVGRKDTQVKIRGQRVELAEVEHQAAAVLGKTAALAAEVVDAKLVLLVEMQGTPDGGAASLVAMLEAELPKRLPRYMVPSTVLPLKEAFPRMSSGKLDRKALRTIAAKLGTELRAGRAERRAAETDGEQKLQLILSRVLNIPLSQIQLDDSFFYLGGDSFLAMKLIAAARAEGLLLSVASVLRHPILSDMAKTMIPVAEASDKKVVSKPFDLVGELATSMQSEVATTFCLQSTDEIEDIYPATPLQEAFMIESSKNPLAYTAQHVVKLPRTADFDIQRFRASWEACVQQNSILRTRLFQTVQTKPPRPMQAVLRKAKVGWEQEDDLQAYLQQARSAPVTLRNKVAIIDDKHSRSRYFVWLAHHSLYDGFSLQMLLQKVHDIYVGNTVATNPVPFRTYIEYLNKIRESEAAAQFWRSYLADAPALTFPPSQSKPAPVDGVMDFNMRIPRRDKAEVTLATALQTAWALLVAACSGGAEDVVFGSIVSGRSAPMDGIEEVMGPTITATPVRVTFSQKERLHDLLLRVQKETSKTIPYEALGLQNIQALSPAASRACSFRNLFVVQPSQPGDAPYEVTSEAIDTGSSFSYPITVVCSQLGDAMVNVNVTYASSVISALQVKQMMDQFEIVVQHLLGAPASFSVRGICIQPIDFAAPTTVPGPTAENAPTRSELASEAELLLKPLWAECLDLDDPDAISADDDFLRLGGDSITAMQLSGITRREGFSLRVVDVLSNTMLSDMAACIASLEETTSTPADDAAFSLIPDTMPLREYLRMAAADAEVQADDVEDMYPCTPLQEGLMTASSTQAGSYVARLVIDIQMDDLNQFKAAWKSVMAAFPILRTRIVHLGPAGMFQVVLKDLKSSIAWQTSSSLDEYTAKDQNEPMSFGDALARYGLIVNPTGVQFVWTAHHAIYDAATVSMLSDALDQHYTSRAVTTPPPFSRYISYLAHQDPAASDTFWRAHLAGAQPTPYPLPPSLDYTPRPDTTTTRTIPLPSPSAGITAATLLQAAWAAVLARRSRARDVVLGVVQSGRLVPVPDIARVPGPTVTTAPLRVRFAAREPIARLLARVQRDAAAALPHAHRGLAAIRRVAAQACDLRSLLTLLPGGAEARGRRFELAEGRAVGRAEAFHTYPLLVECVFEDGAARVAATHDARVIGPRQMAEMLRELEEVVGVFAKGGEGTVEEVALLRRGGEMCVDGGRWLEVEGREFVAEGVERLVSQALWDREVCVRVVKSSEEPGKETLAAFVALGHGYVDDEVAKRLLDALAAGAQDRLGRVLPSFMVPTVFLPVRSLSEAPGEEISRHQLAGLPAIAASEPQSSALVVQESPAVTEREERLGRLWRTILGVDDVAGNNSFLRLGGDSLDAMKLVAAARREGILITVREIFDNPILSDMARVSKDAEVRTAAPSTIPPFSILDGEAEAVVEQASTACGLDPEVIEDIYPCAPLQEGLMALSNVEKGAYVAEYVVPVPDVEKAKTAWKALVDTTPVLRTRIVQTEAWGFLQVVVREDVEILHENNLHNHLADARQKPMSLGSRLVRAGMVTEGESGHLVVFAHHAVFDGWAWNLILHNLYQLYQGQKLLTTQPYNKFIQHIHRELEGGTADDFWRSYLDNADRTSFPPTPVSFVPRPDAHETRHIFLTRKGSNSAHTYGSIIQTAWALLISRYTDSEDVVIGVTLSGRTVPVDGIQDMVGPTFTTIPMRFILGSDKPVSELFDGAQDVSINPAQHIGLQHIRQVSPSAQAACDFNSLLVVQPATQGSDAVSDNFFLRENKSQLISSFTNYGLVLVCQLLPDGGIEAVVVFDSNLVKHQQAVRILAQFEHVLQQLCTMESLSVQDIDFLSPEDEAEVAAYNTVHEPTANADLCMHQVVERYARTQPDSPAVSSWDGGFTYAELNALADNLAGHLQTSMKVFPGDTIPLCFEKSKWTLVAMLAVLKAGAAFVLLDPVHPVTRLESICRKVNAKLAIVSTTLHTLLSHCVHQTIPLDQHLADALPTIHPTVSVTPSHAAYIVTTSGTSGEPKACIIPHASIVAGATSFAATAHLSPSTRALQFASYSFDASLIETLMVWAAGGCTCVLADGRSRADGLTAAIAAQRANWALLTPSLAAVLAPAAVPTLRTVVLGGEAATRELLETWAGAVALLQAYGPCECTPVACCTRAPLGPGAEPRDVGVPLRGVRAWVVLPGDQGRLAPVGSVGELVLEGVTVGEGYVGDAEKSAAAFIGAPAWRKRFQGEVERFYKTGDLVRYGEGGSLVFVGRKDAQVKLRGQRLELAEIECQLRGAMKRRCEVAVELVVPEGQSAAAGMLAAFVAVGGEGAKSALEEALGDARSTLSGVLPSYMVPRVFVPLPALPLSASGKVDRKVLRKLGEKIEEYYDEAEGDVPTTRKEQVLQALWARVLDVQVSRIHTEASFIDLGGDSLAAMRLASKAREAGISLSVADIMRQPRFADMEAKCQPLAETQALPEYKPFSTFSDTEDVSQFLRETLSVELQEIEDVIEATSMQKTMTAAAMSPSQGTVNHVWIDFHGQVNLPRLKEACSKVVNHHGILRTVFVPHEEKLLQVVYRSHTPEFEERQADDNLDDATTALINDSRLRPEAFGKHGLRFCFIHNAPGVPAGRLVMRTPHNLYDGISLPQVLEHLRAAYERRALPSPNPSFSAYLGAWRHFQRTSGAEAFWRKALAGSKMTPITTTADSRPSLTNALVAGHLTARIPAASLVATRHTFEALLHAAWALVLGALSRGRPRDVVFGRGVANRSLPLPGAAAVVGPCLNALPVRVRLDGHASRGALLAAIEDARLAALPFEGLETEALVARCTGWGRGARFSSMLVHNGIDGARAFEQGVLPDWDGVRAGLGWAVSPWDAADVQVTTTPVGGGGVRVDVVFCEEVVPRGVAGVMLETLCKTVERLAVEGGGEGLEGVVPVVEECLPVVPPRDSPLCSVPGSPASVSAGLPSTPESYEIVTAEGWGKQEEEEHALVASASLLSALGDVV